MGLKTTTVVTGKLIRGPVGSGPRGGAPVLFDDRTLNSVLSGVMELLAAGQEDTLRQMGKVWQKKAREHAPIDRGDPIRRGGALRDSIVPEVFIDPTKPEKASLVMQAGGPQTKVADTRNTRGKGWVDYAVLTHEDLGNTAYAEPGTGPKYLETSFNEVKSELARLWTQGMSKAGKK